MKTKRIVLRFFSLFIFSLFGLFILIWFQPVNPVNISLSGYKNQKLPSSYEGAINPAEDFENKGIPSEIKNQVVKALYVFPELKYTSIDFVFTSDGAPLESTFHIPSLFGSKSKRKYIIKIVENSQSILMPIHLNNLPDQAKVGILTHELAHVAYYEKMNTLQIAKWAILYALDSDFRSKHEKSTDRLTIEKGHGENLYAYAMYIRNCDACRPLYERFGATIVDRYYLTPEEIKEIMEN